ncbi:MAG: hypothetical protein HUJ25_08090 [Crocinitomicaceae bacterium]|nr:hypothetical protein [Crocinitomicaceae bacterium]
MVLDDIKVLQDSTYNAYKPKEEKHLIAFFNTGCGHCQDVAAKLGINKNAGQKIDVNCFFVEEEPAIEEFLKNCYGESFKIYQLKDPELFIRLSGFELPSIYLIDRNSSTLKHWTGNVINFSTLDYLLGLDP